MLTGKAPWASKTQFGLALAAMVYGKLKPSVAVLFELQRAFLQAKVPRESASDVMSNSLMALYTFDVIEEEAFLAWKDAPRDEVDGKQGVLQKCTKFFDFLANAEEEEEEEEEELPDVINIRDKNTKYNLK
jgi:eIF4-gamma/eIF5/eIF2-epsilon